MKGTIRVEQRGSSWAIRPEGDSADLSLHFCEREAIAVAIQIAKRRSVEVVVDHARGRAWFNSHGPIPDPIGRALDS